MGRARCTLAQCEMPPRTLPFSCDTYDQWQRACLQLACEHNESIDVRVRREWFVNEAEYERAKAVECRRCSHPDHEGPRILRSSAFPRGAVCAACARHARRQRQRLFQTFDEWRAAHPVRFVAKRAMFATGVEGDAAHAATEQYIARMRAERQREYEQRRRR